MPSSVIGLPLFVLLAFGPLVAFDPVELPALALLLWSLTVIAALAVTIRLRRMDGATLWVWIVVALFAVGYFAKTFFVARWLAAEGVLDALNPEWSDFGEQDLIAGYEVAAAAFVAFVMGALVSPVREMTPARPCLRPERLRFALAATVIVAVVLAIARASLGIGVMGVESAPLPFGIDTLIFRAQSSLIPGVLLVVMWSAEEQHHRRLAVLATVALGAHLVVIAAVSASKAGLFYFAAYVLFLWIICDRLSSGRKLLMAGIAVAALGLFIIGSDLRVLRLEGLSLSEAVEETRYVETDTLAAKVDAGARAFFLRISGADGLWYVLDDRYAAVSSLPDRWAAIWDTSLRDLYTREIVGVTWLQDFRAPGFVAALIILFGVPGVALGLAVGPLVAFAWRWIGSLPGAPALRAFSAVFLLQILMDGIFQWQDFAVYLATLPVLAGIVLALDSDGGRDVAPRLARAIRTALPSGPGTHRNSPS